MRKTFRRFDYIPIMASDFVNTMLRNIFPQLNVEYQLVGPYQPNHGEQNNESPNSIFDEVILRMAAPKSKVNTGKVNWRSISELFLNFIFSNAETGIPFEKEDEAWKI
jgi:hypothetical protein